MKKQNKKEIKFKGEVLTSDYNFQTSKSDVKGSFQIWYPTSKTDVANAIKLTEGYSTLIKSSAHMTKQDITNAGGGIVINLSDLNKITTDNNIVKVGAGTTAESIAKTLVKNNLVLPISNNQIKSIASNLISEEPSYFKRSLGTIASYVQQIQAVKPTGAMVTYSTDEEVSFLSQPLKSKQVITGVEFKAVSSDNLWLIRKTGPYPGKQYFQEISKKILQDYKVPSNIDIVIETYNGPYEIPMLRINAIGKSSENKQEIKVLIEKALNDLPEGYSDDVVDESIEGSEVLTKVMESESGQSFDPAITSVPVYEKIHIQETSEDFLTHYSEVVHTGIAFDNKGKLGKGNNLVSRIQLDTTGQLEYSGFMNSLATKIINPIMTTSALPLDQKINLPFISFATQSDVPGFKGRTYMNGQPGYDYSRKQYATSSYKKIDMSPYMIAYPMDEDDISVIVRFAEKENKHVVARSGGHQYTGKSSGGDDTIVVSMDAFKNWNIDGTSATVGPAVRLTILANEFKSKHLTVPHGECPYVAIGGHAQTGGYGHFLRSFGLLLDHVQSFDIILAGGNKQTVTRPVQGVIPVTNKEKQNNELFWGVLGGNAGSFGIITKYRFEAIRDNLYPKSYGFSTKRKYDKDLFLNMMNEVQKWTVRVKNNTLPPGLDLMMTVVSTFIGPFIIIELVHTNFIKGIGGNSGEQEVNDIKKIALQNISFIMKLLVTDDYKELSELADSFVRRAGTTSDGREFEYPYKKRVNCTVDALSTTFVTGLVNMITKALNTKGVNLVYQMSIGGGKYNDSVYRHDTPIPHSNYTFCFFFHLFYEDGYDNTAIKLQNDMQTIIANDFSPTQELRVFWGTFDDTDMSKLNVQQMYYNDPVKYARLQQLKKLVDPNDIFHTNLTVK